MRLPLDTLAKKHFAFLEKEYSFHRISSSSNEIRWENANVFVALYYDSQRSFELGVVIGQLGILANGQEIPYDLGEIARWSGLTWGTRAVTATNEEQLGARLAEMADVMMGGGRRLLLNETQAYAGLRQQRDRECAAYALEIALRQMRSSAEKAWVEKDFQKIVALYKDHVMHLTPSEKKRYDICIKLTDKK
jgi:hypothetical protein